MELYIGKVAKVPEEHRNSIKLCPKTGNGIAKRMLVNVKNDTITGLEIRIFGYNLC